MKNNGAIIVVADLHLGIKKNAISMPGYFADFVNRLKTIDGLRIKVYDKSIEEKTLKKMTKFMFLGDAVELWDSDDEAVNSCVLSLIPTVSDMEAEKICVLGNHDNILRKAVLPEESDYYFLGKSRATLVEDVYPLKGPLKIGERNYIFLHGHQFDKHFTRTGNLYKLFPELRKVSNSLTKYIIGLFGLSAVLLVSRWMIGKAVLNPVIDRITSLGRPGVFALLFFLTIPRLYMCLARPCWEKINKVKYRRKETIDNFTKWWKKAREKNEVPPDAIVVFGHTHFLNFIESQEDTLMKDGEIYEFYLTKLRKRTAEKEIPTLVNISAWVKDIRDKKEDEKYKNVMVASFLSIDEQGFEFFGWDWYEKRIFHIPKRAIVERRRDGLVSPEMEEILRKIGWPEKLIRKWRTHFTLNEEGFREKIVTAAKNMWSPSAS